MRPVLLLVIMSFFGSSLWGLDFYGIEIDGIEFHGGASLLQNSVEDSAPAPVVMTAGFSLPFKLDSFFTFRPENLFFVQSYGFQNGRAVPMESMYDSVSFLTWILNPAVGAEYPLTPQISLGGEVGIQFYNRFPIFFNGNGGSQALDITSWFYSGRFIFPGAEAHILWQFSEVYTASARVTMGYPVFNLWTGEDWQDQLSLGLNFGLRVRL